MFDDRYLIVRAATLYLAVVSSILVWVWRRSDERTTSGAVLDAGWNLPALLVLHLVATRFGFWHFDAKGGLLLGMPVDFYLAWAWLWGAVPLIAFPHLPLAALAAIAFAVDLVLMPLAWPVLRLGPLWLAGEALALLFVLAPSQLLGRWTARNVRLRERALLQMLAFSGLLAFVIPVVAITNSNNAWTNPIDRPAWALSLLVQLLAIPAVLGLSAVQEFVTRGGGTPVPFDPPRRLVTTGPYAYVRNPMQIAGVTVLVLLGIMLGNVWVSAAGVVAHIYSAGLAGWNEGDDLARRFGRDWLAYRGDVRAWMPRLRPWFPPTRPPRLYVAQQCGVCTEVGRWFEHRRPLHLLIRAAESHPSRALTRITYESADGTYVAEGVDAIARALEHLHVGWAFIGWTMRLPGVRPLVQLMVDASGGGPRTLKVTTLPRRRRTNAPAQACAPASPRTQSRR